MKWEGMLIAIILFDTIFNVVGIYFDIKTVLLIISSSVIY